MSHLVLVRHGESRWNLCNRFTGWVDVPLSENGVLEAQRCAKHCKSFNFSAAFTSRLQRAQATLLIILSQQNRTGIFQHRDDPRYSRWISLSNQCGGDDIPVFADSVLNERYYGVLQGMDKRDAERKFGKEKLTAWRRGYADHPPKGESLEDAHARMHPYLVRTILPRVKRGEDVLLTAHGNTLRAAIKHLENLSDETIAFVDLPEAMPLIYEYRKGRYQRIAGDYRMNRPLR